MVDQTHAKTVAKFILHRVFNCNVTWLIAQCLINLFFLILFSLIPMCFCLFTKL